MKQNTALIDSAQKMKKDNAKIRIIYEYVYRRGTDATTARNINAVFGSDTTEERTVRYWYNRFRNGNFDLKNKPRGRPDSKVIDEELKAIVEADPTQTTKELAAWFDVSIPTILKHLQQIGRIKKEMKYSQTGKIKNPKDKRDPLS